MTRTPQIAGADQAGISILPATIEHLPHIAELAGLSWRAHYPGIISVEQIEYMLGRMYNLDTLRDDITVRGITMDRLLRDTHLIGFAAYGPTDDPGEMKLHKLYLHPDEKRKGYGSLLLRHVEAATRARGYRSLMLTVNRRNHGAVATYRRNGFNIRATVDIDIGHGFVMDDFVMEKKVSSEQ